MGKFGVDGVVDLRGMSGVHVGQAEIGSVNWCQILIQCEPWYLNIFESVHCCHVVCLASYEAGKDV